MRVRPMRNKSSGGNASSNTTVQILVIFVLGCASFYVGILSGVQMGAHVAKGSNGCSGSMAEVGVDRAASELAMNVAEESKARSWEDGDMELTDEEKEEVERLVQERVKAELPKVVVAGGNTKINEASASAPRFPSTMRKFIVGSALIDKDEFTSLLDLGVPVEAGRGSGQASVFLLYNHDSSLPKSPQTNSMVTNNDGRDLPTIPTEEALERCDTLNVILTTVTGRADQCLAIVQNYESYQLQRWMRSAPNTNRRNAIDTNFPLRHISRGTATNGKDNFDPPSKRDILSNFADLSSYIKHFDEVVSDLKPILERIADEKKTVILLTCNKGQSDLLMNFACSARARGMEDVLKHVLVFPTDLETKELAEGLGLNTYYDERNLGKMPSGEARSYGDSVFTAMMYAKVVCVQLVNFLGYNLLFQDVDVVWYQNPLTFFYESEKSGNFDIYFQDDGQHSVRYAPYSANSGFYYVRHNIRTQYLFTALLYAGDLIKAWKSHQQALVALLTDHASYYGLRVKVLSRDDVEFPGGFHYHRRREFMRSLVQGKEKDTYIFHMSWTTNKDNKLKFFKQMGEWYLKDGCGGKTLKEIVGDSSAAVDLPLVAPCCLAEPKIVCHYSDKPSKIPCKNSPTIDKGGRPFW